ARNVIRRDASLLWAGSGPYPVAAPGCECGHTPQAGRARVYKSPQAARRTAAARPISAVPMRTIAASSRRRGIGRRTCCTATGLVAFVSERSGGAGAAAIDAVATLPITANPARYLRMTLLPLTRALDFKRYATAVTGEKSIALLISLQRTEKFALLRYDS